jgi:shikimate dehydrogenase
MRMTSGATSEPKLGLIGVGIGRSRAPMLHRLTGELSGLTITYDLIQLESSLLGAFDNALETRRARGYRGVNVTYPFKERAAEVVEVAFEVFIGLRADEARLREALRRSEEMSSRGKS